MLTISITVESVCVSDVCSRGDGVACTSGVVEFVDVGVACDGVGSTVAVTLFVHVV